MVVATAVHKGETVFWVDLHSLNSGVAVGREHLLGITCDESLALKRRSACVYSVVHAPHEARVEAAVKQQPKRVGSEGPRVKPYCCVVPCCEGEPVWRGLRLSTRP